MPRRNPLKKLKPIKRVSGWQGQDHVHRKPEYPEPSRARRERQERRSRQQEIYNTITRGEGVASDWAVSGRIAGRLEPAFPEATLPEMVVYDYLLQEGVEFTYQAEVLGGRARGGLIPDFVVHIGGGYGAAWQVQGSYFHSAGFQTRFDQVDRDIQAELILKGKIVDGVQIKSVIQLLEDEIYYDRPDVFIEALVP